MSMPPGMWRSDCSLLLFDAIRSCSRWLALAWNLTRSENPSAILHMSDGDVLRTRSRRIPVRVSDRHLTHGDQRHAELPLVDDPGSGWDAEKMSESSGVELADHAGVHETEYNLAQLGCLLVDPQHASDVRHLTARYGLERNPDLATTVRLAHHPEAVGRGKLLRQQHRFVGGVIMPARLRVAEDVTVVGKSSGIDRPEGSPVRDRKDVAVRPEHGPIPIEFRSISASLTDA